MSRAKRYLDELARRGVGLTAEYRRGFIAGWMRHQWGLALEYQVYYPGGGGSIHSSMTEARAALAEAMERHTKVRYGYDVLDRRPPKPQGIRMRRVDEWADMGVPVE